MYFVTCGSFGVNWYNIKSGFGESGFSLAGELAIRRNGQYRLVALALCHVRCLQNASGLF
jgi:hypothetical protein